MKKAQKKGFTIVELLVVIAVIAVLAAVMIPVMITLIDDAKVSNDEQVVSSLNRAIAAETGDIDTMSDAVDAAADYGYDVEKLTLESDSDVLVWDQDSKYFGIVTTSGEEVYSNGGLTDEDGHLWVITDGSSDTAEESGAVTLSGRTIVASAASELVYSSYLVEGYEGDTTFSAGVDVGKNEDLSIAVETSYDVLVNANGGSVTVSGSGSVSFYGETNGITLESGTLTVTSGSSVSSIVVTATEASSVTLTLSGGASVDAVAAQDGVLTSANFVNSAGAAEDLDVSAEDIAIGQEFSGGVGTESNPFLISSVDDFETFGLSSVASDGTYAGTPAYGGYNWKVTCDLDLSGVSHYVFSSAYTDGYFVYDFLGNIDFDNHSVTGLGSCFLFWYVDNPSVISNLNVTLSTDYSLMCYVWMNDYTDTDNDDVVLSNITTDGSFETTSDNNAAALVNRVVGAGSGDEALIIKDCTNYCDIYSTADSSAGIFLGKVADDDGYSAVPLTFENCVNYGTLIHSNGYAAMLIANACTFTHESTDDITVTNCVNYGTIIAYSGSANLLCGGSYSGYDASTYVCDGVSNGIGGTQVAGSDAIGEITVSDDSLFVFPEFSGASYYILTFSMRANVYAEGETVAENWGSIGISCTFTSLPSNLPAYGWVSAADVTGDTETITCGDTSLTVSDSSYVCTGENTWIDTYGYLDNGYTFTISGVTVTLYAYDADGNVVGIAIYIYS